MLNSKVCGTAFLALVLLFSCSEIVSALDTVYLKSGRILRGTVSEGKAEKGGAFIVLRTESGAEYKLDKGDIVKTILKREKVDNDYEAKLRHIRDIATDHIELVEWCEDQDRGKTRFKEQIRWHYENVIRLDPDHKKARGKLGYMKLSDGTWVAAAEFKSRQGYQKDRKDWVTGLSQEVESRDKDFEAQMGAKKKEFNRWRRAAKKGNFQPAVLAQICDAYTLPMVYKSALDFQFNVELCRVHLDAIATVRNSDGIRALAHFAIENPNQDLREHAISLLSQPEMDHVTAILILKGGLKFSDNWYVKNAAFAMGEVASADDFSRDFAIVPLSEALITEHVVKIEGALEPGRMNPTFGNGGSGLQMGGGPQTRLQAYRNRQSLDALKRLTEVDFQYDEQAWRDWYIENYTLSDMRVRGDD